MNNGFLIPANAKRGSLWFNIFRPFDMALFCGGVVLSLIMLMVVPSSSTVGVLIALIPGCLCALLVVPVPNYHNILCALIAIYDFYTNRRRYIWKGWCFHELAKEFESKSGK